MYHNWSHAFSRGSDGPKFPKVPSRNLREFPRQVQSGVSTTLGGIRLTFTPFLGLITVVGPVLMDGDGDRRVDDVAERSGIGVD